MHSHSLNHTDVFHINSFLYTYDSSLATSPSNKSYVSPKDYQKNCSSNTLSSRRATKKVTKNSKKIILGKPIVDGKKQKMSLEELKALSRQIRPHTTTSPLTKFNSRNKGLLLDTKVKQQQPDIIMLSRNLRENLSKAKSKMMDSLKKSNTPQDVQIYEYLNKEESMPSSPSLSCTTSSSSSEEEEEEEEDDCDSVNSGYFIQLRLVTNDSGSVSVVPSSVCDSQLSSSSASTVSSFDDSMMNETLYGNDDDDDFMPLYTPNLYTSPSIMNMELFFQSPHWTPTKTMPCSHSDVTEDQINSWLQRGGFGDNMSPITMATDQELADLLDFDM